MTRFFERPRLTEQVVTHLTRMITEAAWPPGTALPPEADLAQQLGVSRTVIREGVRVLASRGMLDVRQGRGTFVTPATAWTVAEPLALLVKADRPALRNWLEVRTILELESARLAAERAGERDRAELAAALQRVCDVTQQPEEYVEADIALHGRIAQATQNPQLRLLVQTLVQPLRLELHETVQIPTLTEAATREHTALVERILAGDGVGARAAMGAHLRRVAEEINQVLHEPVPDEGRPGPARSAGPPV
jgi:GntR family transcriptional repressor for pyruvate dehydrogenase complex